RDTNLGRPPDCTESYKPAHRVSTSPGRVFAVSRRIGKNANRRDPMQERKRDAKPSRIGPVHALLAAAALGLVRKPPAFAGAQPKGSASAKRQLKALTQRVALLEAKRAPTALPPSGPAGGDLTGSYPNPRLGPNTVGEGNLMLNSIGAAALQANSVGDSALQ